ncbi:ABC transporter substrate-binding protein [Cohnella cholangitidis]|uniref:Extracellular solute-binding protein n=1 Tax=Cohnella cholangitidis TaxID=2598458 RepID=A0A7G5C4D9_9BACL|nr:extracellular solute-binding protein [Cohnella cholangitidis]QMV44073.1 extracellular solute-binding protein [Cohnella cholangitidis]
MFNKKAITATLLASMMLVAACSGGNNEPGKESAASQPAGSAPANSGKTVELRMSWWGSDERHEKTQKVIELFEQKNPGVKITGEYSGFDGYMDKLNTQIAAGNAPDLIQMGGNIKEYVDKKALLDLTPYVGNVLHVDDFNGGLVKAASFDEKLYGVTLGVSSSALMYNASMFEKAGVPLPTDKWNYDDFKNSVIQIAQKLGKGNYGSYDLSSDAATLASFLGSNGKELYRDGERHFDNQDMINWFALWDELRKAGAIVPADVQVANPPTAVDKSLVVKGQVAIQQASASQIFGFQELTQDKLALSVFPYGPAGSGMVPPISGQFITSYSGTEHPEEVAKFMDFMVNDPEAGVILGSTRGVPPAGKIRDVLSAQATPVDKVLYDYISLVSDTAPEIEYQQFPLDNEFIKLLQLTSEKIAFGAQPIDSSVEEFMSEMDKLLAKSKAQ